MMAWAALFISLSCAAEEAFYQDLLYTLDENHLTAEVILTFRVTILIWVILIPVHSIYQVIPAQIIP